MPAGRYAPSPTGTLHLGNLRTALLAWLFARSTGSRFVMRIEDVDRGRSRERFVTEQLADLSAIGLDWDDQVVRQSERGPLYGEALAQLEGRGLVYPCWCTRAEIREASVAPHGALPEGSYPGTCRDLSPVQRRERAASGRRAALRVRAGSPRVTVGDRLLGEVVSVVDDFVLRRGDGDWAYNLAVVVDDHEQGVEEVVRGADLLETTPRQAWLHRTLGYGEPPAYAHVPLMLGRDGARLAKRHGAVTLADRAAEGQSPEEVRSELAASVGLCGPDDRPSPAELVSSFSAGALPADRRPTDAQ